MPEFENQTSEEFAEQNSGDFDIKNLFPDLEVKTETEEEKTEETTEEVTETTEGETETTETETAEVEKETEQVDQGNTNDKDTAAFIKMREQIAQLKKANEELLKAGKETESEQMLRDMAISNGYTDLEAFKQDYKDSKIKQEAETKGVDPEFYKKSIETDKRLADLEQIEKDRVREYKLNEFDSTLAKVIRENELPESVKEELIDKLGNEGYDLELLLAVPSFESLIKGALADKILAVKQQKQLEREKAKSSVADEVITTTPGDLKFDLDKFVSDQVKKLNLE